ncbi:MAG: hypothetical protein ACX936_21445 [Marinobacter sp.]
MQAEDEAGSCPPAKIARNEVQVGQVVVGTMRKKGAPNAKGPGKARKDNNPAASIPIAEMESGKLSRSSWEKLPAYFKRTKKNGKKDGRYEQLPCVSQVPGLHSSQPYVVMSKMEDGKILPLLCYTRDTQVMCQYCTRIFRASTLEQHTCHHHYLARFLEAQENPTFNGEIKGEVFSIHPIDHYVASVPAATTPPTMSGKIAIKMPPDNDSYGVLQKYVRWNLSWF